MSQYPRSYGYGQYHGQRPPQPYGYQNGSSYAAPAPGAPYNPFALDITRGASQAAYSFNATHIPGLGVAGGAPGGTHYNFASGPTSWRQQLGVSESVPPVPTPQVGPAGAFDSRPSQPALKASGPNRSAKSSNLPPVPSHPTSNMDLEEGELSEGQFEDLYEPREYVSDTAVQPISRPLLAAGPSQPTSAADTPDGGFYGSDEDGGEKVSKDNEDRERSASYSPFLSPREIQSGVPTPRPVADKQDEPTRAAAATLDSAVPGLQHAAPPPPNGIANKDLPQQKDFLSSFKSLQEAKKEARKAILRLWPLGVKYQNYIDEGFDETVIKGLFGDLHLDIPKPTTDAPATKPAKSQETERRRSSASNSTMPGPSSDIQPQKSASVSKDSSAMPGQPGNGEERKDRIARLLAAKKAKAPAEPKPAPAATQTKPSATEAPARDAAPISPASDSSKPKSWGDKERLIQQKIAALQKSREAQAQKPAADKADSGNGPGAAGSETQALHPPEKTSPGPAALSISTAPRAAPPQASATPSSQSQPSPSMSGLLTSTSADPNLSSQRKRPVASDFVEYSTGSGSVKRPFGQARKETSLIIHVSDASEDEEMEMDMDVESPVDEPSPIRSGSIPAQRGPSIRDFPPLTNTPAHRAYSSPAPQTPPPGAVNNKTRETELDLKEKAIQEMRRKIALAEARRRAKQPSGGSVTPRQTEQTPELREPETSRPLTAEQVPPTDSPDRQNRSSPQLTPETSSLGVPKRSETLHPDPLRRAERRGRIVSLDLPRVESTLEEKLDRLKRLQEEETQLRAEIEANVAEKQKLTSELEELGTATPAQSPQPNGLGSGDGSEVAVPQTEGASPDIQPSSSAATPPVSQGSQESGEVSTDEAGPSAEQSPGRPCANEAERKSRSPGSTSRASAGEKDANDNSVQLARDQAGLPLFVSAGDSSHAQQNAELPSAGVEMNAQEDDAIPSVAAPASDEIATNNAAILSMPGQADLMETGENTPMELDSRSTSPEAAERVSSIDTGDEMKDTRQASAPLPEQISSVAQPREESQELENKTTGEAPHEPLSNAGSTLTPYESPLRYFHAYRFHPDYQRTVAGGLKSLTYSNRIDPDKELCPSELNGDQCPANCEFQHFDAIGLPDDQILLELGNPDDYSGEDKNRFIQGLRELLQRFKAEKVKDFNSIARGIVEFRAQVLGDRSKVLRLDGVNI